MAGTWPESRLECLQGSGYVLLNVLNGKKQLEDVCAEGRKQACALHLELLRPCTSQQIFAGGLTLSCKHAVPAKCRTQV